jgi:hypothetical protein
MKLNKIKEQPSGIKIGDAATLFADAPSTLGRRDRRTGFRQLVVNGDDAAFRRVLSCFVRSFAD